MTCVSALGTGMGMRWFAKMTTHVTSLPSGVRDASRVAAQACHVRQTVSLVQRGSPVHLRGSTVMTVLRSGGVGRLALHQIRTGRPA